jgi:hypothetical protein
VSLAGNGATLAKFLALVDDGTAARELRAARSRSDWARRLGISESSLRSTIVRARAAGIDVPDWGDAGSGEDVTQAATPRAIAEQDNRDFDVEEPTKNEGTRKPGSFVVPENFDVRAKSTLVRADGSVVLEWVKTSANHNVDPVAVLRAAFGEAMPKCESIPLPNHGDEDLMCGYWLGDPHCGMLAWADECGENFDLAIFERQLVSAADRLVATAPPAKYAVVASVGDYFHSDGLNNSTTKGTRVDVDGRTPKMIATGIRTMRRIIERALEKHEHVHVICARGNHDELLSLVLALALSQFYESNPRVTVDTSPEMYHWYRFGKNLIGVTHGDKAKPMDMMGVMACDRAKDWGETIHRFLMCGHVHHSQTKEVPGVVVEYLRTLAGTDAWHRGQGYRSGRDMKMDVFHREHGRITRNTVGIEQIRRGA